MAANAQKLSPSMKNALKALANGRKPLVSWHILDNENTAAALCRRGLIESETMTASAMVRNGATFGCSFHSKSYNYSRYRLTVAGLAAAQSI